LRDHALEAGHTILEHIEQVACVASIQDEGVVKRKFDTGQEAADHGSAPFRFRG
jgi:hypothetical protein